MSWLATSVTAFIASAFTGALLVGRFGVRRLLITGLLLRAIGVLWLARVPADADYLTDLLPAFVLAGIAIGLCAPSAQIGALAGVTDTATGFAAGLVETMREVGGAAGIAAVSTVLVSQVGLTGFHAAFVVICIAGALGAIPATVAFERPAQAADESAIGPGLPPGTERSSPSPFRSAAVPARSRAVGRGTVLGTPGSA